MESSRHLAGPSHWALSFGGLNFTLTVVDPLLAAALAQRYQEFITPPTATPPATLHFLIEIDQAPDTLGYRTEIRPSDSPNTPWAPEYRLIDGRREVKGTVSLGTIDLGARYARIEIGDPLGLAILEADYFLRVAASLAAFAESGLLVHAAAARRGDRGYLLVGPSGAGKTTAAGNAAAGVRFIQDDLVVLRYHEGRWWAHATPFTGPGQMRGPIRPEAVGLETIAVLKQSPQISFSRLPEAQGLAALAAAVSIVSVDAELAPQLLPRLLDLMAAVPVGELCLRPDASYWSVLP